jgi:glutamine cyclotransferase
MCSTLGPPSRFDIVNRYPHDTTAYTQGLLFHEGNLYESTGRYRRSTLREVELESGRVLRSRKLDDRILPKDWALHNNRLIQLTWRSGIGFAYQLKPLNPSDSRSSTRRRVGLTSDGKRLIFSDGTDTLRFLDPDSFQTLHTLHVADGGKPVLFSTNLNTSKEFSMQLWNSNRIAPSRREGSRSVVDNLTALGQRPGHKPPSRKFERYCLDATGNRCCSRQKLADRFEIRLRNRSEILQTLWRA